jgi:spermidine synthase
VNAPEPGSASLPRVAGVVVLGFAAVAAGVVAVAELVLPHLAQKGNAAERTLYERDSFYHHIRVYESGDTRFLRLDQRVHSASAIRDPLEARTRYTPYLHLPLAMNRRAHDVLFIGLGGGTVPNQFLHDYPNVRIDVAELDPEVVTVARRFFGYPGDSARLRTFAEDGRRFLERSDRKYDLIIIDAYQRDFIPFHLVTREFFELCRAKLNDDGLVAMNVFGAPAGLASEAVASVWVTAGKVFDERYLFAVDYRRAPSPRLARNCILVAGKGLQMPDAQLFGTIDNARAAGVNQQYIRNAGDLVPSGPDPARAKVFSDQYAPVEDMLRVF